MGDDTGESPTDRPARLRVVAAGGSDLPESGDLVRLDLSVGEEFFDPAWLRVSSSRPSYWADGWIYLDGVLLADDGAPVRRQHVLVRQGRLIVYRVD